MKNERFSTPEFEKVLSGEKVLRSSDKGESVVILQKALQDMGFPIRWINDNSKERQQNGVDGSFGAQIKIALQNFQIHCKLNPTGELDAVTLQSLDEHAPPPDKKLWDHSDLNDIPVPSFVIKGKPLHARIVVVKAEKRTFLFSPGGKLAKIYPNAIGRIKSATDSGLRIIRGILDQSDAEAAGRDSKWKDPKIYGTRYINLDEVNSIDGSVKPLDEDLHGTDERSSIGKEASHGCVRHYSEDIEEISTQVGHGDYVLILDRWNTKL